MNGLRQRLKGRLRSAVGADGTQAVIDELRATVAEQRTQIGDLERELARVSPQVAALEARLETLREKVEGVPLASVVDGSAAEVDYAGSDIPGAEALWAELQRQQEQVRARLGAATRFEERLRKLEEDRAHR